MEEFKSFVSKFTPYLEDIRRRLYYTAFFFALAFVGGFFGTRYILHAILSIFELNNVSIVTTSPFQFADLSIDIGIFFAFLISFPVLIYNIYSFFGPAFNKREKRVMLFLVPCSLILFIFGFFYGFAIMYYALMILAEINIQVGIKNIWDVGGPWTVAEGNELVLTPVVTLSSGVTVQGPAAEDLEYTVSDPLVASVSFTETELVVHGNAAGTTTLQISRRDTSIGVLPDPGISAGSLGITVT